MTHNILNIQVKLGEPGWRDRYYEEKFGARTSERMEDIRRDVVSILWEAIHICG
jgi:5'-3' exonuclease